MQDAKQEQIDFLASRAAMNNKANPLNALWKDITKDFIEYAIKYKKTTEAYKFHFRTFDRLTPIKFLNEATTSKFNEYIDKRLSLKLSKSSINRELNTFRALFSYLINVKDYDIKHPLNRKIPRFSVKSVIKERVLSKEEIEKIFSHIPNKYKSIGLTAQEKDVFLTLIYLGLYAGLRLKEALNLKRKDILFSANTIIVEPHKTFNYNADTVSIPLSQKLSNYLKSAFRLYPNEAYAVPILNDNQRVSRSPELSHKIITLFKKIGIKNAGMHTLRHTFVSMLANSNIDSVDVMEYARIKSIAILKIYRHVTTEKHLTNINSLPY
jgi:integrase